jgi:hypothetical protein
MADAPCAKLAFHRGPKLTGRAYCGRGVIDPTRIMTVLITHSRDPSWTPLSPMTWDEGEWRDDILLESLEAFAMLRLLSRGFYVTAP